MGKSTETLCALDSSACESCEMVGSQKLSISVPSSTDPILASRLESIKQLAGGLSDRLAVLPLYLLPLRERREDIPLLVEHFVAGSCKRHRQPLRTISPDGMQELTEAPWPNNARELQHYIERAVVTTTGPALSCADLVTSGSKLAEHDLCSVSRGAVTQAERMRIVQALHQAGGNRVKTAKLFKVSRAILYNKLRDLNIRKV